MTELMMIIEELEKIFSSFDFTNETIFAIFLLIFVLFEIKIISKFIKKEKGMIEEIQGEWVYKLIYTLNQNKTQIDVLIEGEFKLGVAPDSNNKHLIINGKRNKISAKYYSSNKDEVGKNLKPEVTWKADWAQYCHDKKIRFTYDLLIPNSDNSDNKVKVKVLVESDDFARGQRTIRGKQYLLMDDRYKSLLSNDNRDTGIRILDDLTIPYKTFFQSATIEANKR